MARRDIIAIGGSAGSTAVLKVLLGGLPADFPAALFVTTHLPSTHPSYLADILGGASALRVSVAVDGQPVERGRVYVAAPDRHLLVLDSTIRLGAGPRENLTRPSIDPMFRSVALSYGPRSVGLILSGMLNDGASGLRAIQQMGGVTVVQHPLDAQAPEMPRAAIEAVQADHVGRRDDLADILKLVVQSEAGPAPPPSETLLFEVEVANGARLGSATLRHFAQPSGLTCPDCNGVLSEVGGEQPLRYRCQIGHAYTAEHLAARQEAVDDAIRLAMRVMEERVELVERMARDARDTGRCAVAELYESRAEEYRRYATTLREAALLAIRSRHADEEPL